MCTYNNESHVSWAPAGPAEHGKGTDPQQIELKVQGGNGEDAGPAALAPDLGPDGRPTPIQLPK